MKKTKIFAVLIIATQIIGIGYSFAIDYSKIKTKTELCKVAFNTKLDSINEGCLLGKLDGSLAKNIKIKIKNKEISGEKLLKVINHILEKKYKKKGLKGDGIIKAKEKLFQKLLKIIGNKFEHSNNQKAKKLMGSLYLTLSIGKSKLAEEYSKSSSKLETTNQLHIGLYNLLDEGKGLLSSGNELNSKIYNSLKEFEQLSSSLNDKNNKKLLEVIKKYKENIKLQQEFINSELEKRECFAKQNNNTKKENNNTKHNSSIN